MENEIMNNEAIETAEEILDVGSGKGFKVAAGIGVTVLVGVIAYKYVVKPAMAKLKSKKNPDGIIEADFVPAEDDGEE